MDQPHRIQTMMIIDDDEVDQIMYRRIVQRSGLVDNLLSYRSAEDALQFLKDEGDVPVDVIFLDINMPRMNGFEFLDHATAELGVNFAKAVVIMLTTSLNPEDQERAAQYEIVRGYNNKPLTNEQIRDAARMLNEP